MEGGLRIWGGRRSESGGGGKLFVARERDPMGGFPANCILYGMKDLFFGFMFSKPRRYVKLAWSIVESDLSNLLPATGECRILQEDPSPNAGN